MANLTRNLNILIWGIVVAVTQAVSQPQSESLTVRFTVFSATTVEPLVFFQNGKLPPKSLTFYTVQRSLSFDYRGSSDLNFYDPASLAEAERRIDGSLILPEPIAVARVPSSMSEILLLFSPPITEASGRRYQVTVLDDSVSGLPRSTVRFVNTTDRRYRATLEDGRVINLPNGTSSPIKVLGSVKIALEVQFHEQWIRSGDSELLVGSDDRTWAILSPPRRATQLIPQIRLLRDLKKSAPVPSV